MGNSQLMRSLKNFFQTWSREDTLIVSSLVGGLSFLFLIVFITPMREIALGNPATIEKSEEEQGANTGGRASKDEKGVYRFGKLVVSLGAHDEYLDSDLDIEYDMGVMRIHADGSVEDIKSANKFCDRNKTRMKDAIIAAVSSISVQQIKAVGGMSDFKSAILEAVNEAVSGQGGMFTNVFFRKFLLLPAET